MLSFSKLTLTGFKSFVDATELPIEAGLTGVVGPNGCGKSNLVEALRWAMGETSARRMRGEGMDDIIFAGSSARPRRDYAEVALFLAAPPGETQEGDLPAPFAGEEQLMVSRSIAREGGTRYRINGADVRARDVQTLFADAATGAQSPSIVRQGRIVEMISAKPIDRRRFLEEAAGVSGLHVRRREAESKLKAAGNNIARLEEVLKTVENQRRALHQQAREAARYHDLARELRQAESMVLHLEWLQAEDTRRKAAESLEEAERRVREATAASEQAATEQAQAGTQLPALRQAAMEAGAALEGLEGERRALSREMERAGANLASAERRLEQLEADRGRTAGQRRDAEAALARLAAEEEAEGAPPRTEAAGAGAGTSAAESAGQDEAEGEGKVARTGEDEERRGARLEEAQRKAEETLAAREAESGGLEEARRKAEAEEARAAALAESLRTRRKECEAERRELEDGAAPRDSGEAAPLGAEEAQAAESEAEAALAAARRSLSEAERALAQAERRASALEAECETLARAVAPPQAELWPPLLGETEAEEGFERALAAALGDDLMASRREGAPLGWRELPGTEALPPLPSGAAPLSERVRAPSLLARRLSQVGLVKSEAEGDALQPALAPGQRLVSESGALWRWDGFSAAEAGALPAVRRLRQSRSLRERREEAARLKQEAARLGEACETERSALAESEERAKAARTACRDAWAAAAAERKAEELAGEEKRLVQALAEAEAALERAASAAREARLAAGEAAGALNAAREALAGAAGEALLFAREEEARRDRAARRASEAAAWQGRLAEAERHERVLSERESETRDERRRLAEAPAALKTREEALVGQIRAAEGRRDQAGGRLEGAEELHRAAADNLRAAEKRLAERREERVREEGRLEQQAQRLAALAERAEERLGVAPAALLAASGHDQEKPLPAMEQARKRMDRLTAEKERIGPVNLRAESEIRSLEERIGEMTGERDELEEGIARLRQGIQTLNREGRRRLLEAFEKVNSNFASLFARLFGGGEASLKFVESDDPLLAGLEVMASPPGKRLQSLSLLSGGEQSLTALALLFAVFLVNPAPICVLDEVDAALDDINVHRFCDLLEELARRSSTRFLVITHHRHTMARMDRLFGVTMPERGVSKLVSVDLARAEALRETA